MFYAISYMNIETETPKPQTFVDNNKINAAKGISVALFVLIPYLGKPRK